MAQTTKVVLNCVGPYRLYGEPVVQACVVAGTDYLDVCGEPGMIYFCREHINKRNKQLQTPQPPHCSTYDLCMLPLNVLFRMLASSSFTVVWF